MQKIVIARKLSRRMFLIQNFLIILGWISTLEKGHRRNDSRYVLRIFDFPRKKEIFSKIFENLQVEWVSLWPHQRI